MASNTTSGYLYFVTCTAALGGLLLGYESGITSAAFAYLSEHFDLTDGWQVLLLEILKASAILAAFSCSWFTRLVGRKPVIMTGAALHLIGSVALASSSSKAQLLVGRFVVGTGLGLVTVSVPMYIAEIAPAVRRGRLVAMFFIFLAVGQLIAALFAGFNSTDKENGWRYMFGAAGILSLVQLIGIFFSSESPRWLIAKSRELEAKVILRRLRGKETVQVEIDGIKSTANYSLDGCPSAQIFVNPGVRRVLLVGCILFASQQLSGTWSVTYYSEDVIYYTSLLNTYRTHSELNGIILSVITLVSTIVGFFLIDRLGRRIQLLISLFVIVISLIMMGIGFQLTAKLSTPIEPANSSIADTDITPPEVPLYILFCWLYPTCQECLSHPSCGLCYTSTDDDKIQGYCIHDTSIYPNLNISNGCVNLGNEYSYRYETCPVTSTGNSYGYVLFAGLLLFTTAYSTGLNILPLVINAELFPYWARDCCMSTCVVVYWLVELISSMFSLNFVSAVSRQAAFYSFAGISLAGLIFLIFFLPETKGKTLEEIEAEVDTAQDQPVSSQQNNQDVVTHL